MKLSQSKKRIHIFIKGFISKNLNLQNLGIEIYRYNRFIILANGFKIWKIFQLFRLWYDPMNNRLEIEIEKRLKTNYNSNKMWEIVRFVADQYSTSLPKEYLKSLKWNGNEENIKRLLPKYLGTEDTELNKWIMEHMLIGMVSRIFNSGNKLDEMMILVGGHSIFVQKLAILPEWYCAIQFIDGKDAIMNLMGKTAVEIEEFVALRNAKSANELRLFYQNFMTSLEFLMTGLLRMYLELAY